MQKERITINTDQCGGQPCIRGMRIRVADILGMLGRGIQVDEILADFPDLERADVLACQDYAEQRALATAQSGGAAMSTITVDQLKHLSFSEKLQLVEDLWDDIARDAAAQAITPELERELEQALEEYRLNPNEGESWDAVKTEILRTLS